MGGPARSSPQGTNKSSSSLLLPSLGLRQAAALEPTGPYRETCIATQSHAACPHACCNHGVHNHPGSSSSRHPHQPPQTIPSPYPQPLSQQHHLQGIGRALDMLTCLSARLVCSSWCEGISASISSMCLTPGIVKQLGPAAVARALERMAQADAVDIAVGPLRRRAAPSQLELAHILGEMIPGFQQAGAGGAAAAAAGPGGLAADADGANNAAAAAAAPMAPVYDQLRPYSAEDMEQLLQLLAEHRPTQKLPTLYVYTESMSAKDRPGLLSLQGDWRSSYIKVGSRGWPWGLPSHSPHSKCATGLSCVIGMYVCVAAAVYLLCIHSCPRSCMSRCIGGWAVFPASTNSLSPDAFPVHSLLTCTPIAAPTSLPPKTHPQPHTHTQPNRAWLSWLPV